MSRNNLYKIGFSISPDRRALALGAAIIHAFPSEEPYAVEQQLHAFFTAKRVNGEWFALDGEDVALICGISACPSVSDLPEAVRASGRASPYGWGSSEKYPAVRIAGDLWEAMKSLAAENGRPVTWEIRRAIDAWIAKHRE
jgi:hypothetical protein